MRISKSNFELLQKLHRDYNDQLYKVLNSPFAEIDPTFLCFSEVYKAVAENTPKDMIIIDLGCYAGLQSAFFENYKAYVGVDSVPIGFIGMEKKFPEELSEKDFYVPRLENANNHYFVTTIQHFIETMKENGFDPDKCMAIMSYVPDKDAYHKAMEVFPNIAAYYPGDHYEKNIFRLHGKEIPMKTLMDRIDDRDFNVVFNDRTGEFETVNNVLKDIPLEEEEMEEER